MSATLAITEVAELATYWFEQDTRSNTEETFLRLKDGAPEWVAELVRFAHGDFLPDDWRYDCIVSALHWIIDNSDEPDALAFADQQVDIYTGRRIQWLATNLLRASYCDDAKEEGLVDPEMGIVDRIGVGQYVEASEIFGLVIRALEEAAETLTHDATV